MATESATQSKSLDRQLYLRLMVETLLYGQPELRDKDWRVSLRTPRILAADAKSLYHNLEKDGSLPAERQTWLDVLVARDLVEQKCISLRWLPNNHLFADFLTKPEVVTPNLLAFLILSWCLLRHTLTMRRIAFGCVVARGSGRREGRKLEGRASAADSQSPWSVWPLSSEAACEA